MRGASASWFLYLSSQLQVVTSSVTGMAPRLAFTGSVSSCCQWWAVGVGPWGWRRREAPLTLTLCALSPAHCLSASMLLRRCSTPSAGPTPTSLLSPRAFWPLSAAPLPSWLESKCAFGRRLWRAPWKRYDAARRGHDLEPGRPESRSQLCY